MRLAGRRLVHTRLPFVVAVDQEVEHEKRVRRAALPQVDLDGMAQPSRAPTHRDEIDGESAERPPVSKHAPDALSVVLEPRPIGLASRELTSHEDLTRGSAKTLLVGGHDLDVPSRIDAALRGRRVHLVAGHSSLDDATHRRELLAVAAPGFSMCFEGQTRPQLLRDPRLGASATVALPKAEAGVALSGEPVVELHDGAVEIRVPAP